MCWLLIVPALACLLLTLGFALLPPLAHRRMPGSQGYIPVPLVQGQDHALLCEGLHSMPTDRPTAGAASQRSSRSFQLR